MGTSLESPNDSAGTSELKRILWPSLQVGGLSGTTGLLIGSVSGILRSSTPALFALTSGIQWFVLGSTFWATRNILLQMQAENQRRSSHEIYASGLAGSVAGGIGGLLRSPKNVLPGAIVFGLIGTAGQAMSNAREKEPPTTSIVPSQNDSLWSISRWTPMKALSDEEYKAMLEEKLLRVSADIAMVDERIEALRGEQIRRVPQNSDTSKP